MAGSKRIGVFLDLQGTLGGDPLGDVTDFSFYPNSKEALKLFAGMGIRLFIITNQSRIAKGLISQAEFDGKMGKLIHELESDGIHIDKVFCCPHQKSDNCVCRKPSVYFPTIAQQEFNIELSRSFFVGDIYRSDMGLAKQAGGIGVLVLTGQGKKSLEQMSSLDAAETYDKIHVATDILEAAEWITAKLRED